MGLPDRVAPDPTSRELLDEVDLCTFNWNTRDGWPMGATVAFLWIDQRLWFSMDASEARVKALRRDPRAACVWTDSGPRSVTVKGRVSFAEALEDRRLVYRAVAEKQARMTRGARDADAYARYLEEKGSIVMELIPEKWIAYDARKLPNPVAREASE